MRQMLARPQADLLFGQRREADGARVVALRVRNVEAAQLGRIETASRGRGLQRLICVRGVRAAANREPVQYVAAPSVLSAAVDEFAREEEAQNDGEGESEAHGKLPARVAHGACVGGGLLAGPGSWDRG